MSSRLLSLPSQEIFDSNVLLFPHLRVYNEPLMFLNKDTKHSDRARPIMHDAVRVIIGQKNTVSETVKQKLDFAGTEEGKLLALRQSFAQETSLLNQY